MVYVLRGQPNWKEAFANSTKLSTITTLFDSLGGAPFSSAVVRPAGSAYPAANLPAQVGTKIDRSAGDQAIYLLPE